MILCFRLVADCGVRVFADGFGVLWFCKWGVQSLHSLQFGFAKFLQTLFLDNVLWMALPLRQSFQLCFY